MPRTDVSLLAFNRGVLSPRALSRLDMKRTAFSAEIQENWMPRTYGSMALRTGREYLGTTYNNEKSVSVPFIYSLTDLASIEVGSGHFVVSVDNAFVSRPSVSTAVTNGSFESDLTGWADEDETGATSAWATGGYMSLVGTGYNFAVRTQTLSISSGDQNKRHALRIIVSKGRATFRVGSTSGGDEYIEETVLSEGEHSLSFTPTGSSVYLRLSSETRYATKISSCLIEASGTMVISSPWVEADLPLIRTEQSGDVVYVWCKGHQPRKIERRGTYSWSLVKYQPEDGPFRSINNGPVTITPSAQIGDVTLTASKRLFKSDHVGALWRITSIGQAVSADLSGSEQYTEAIRVTGVDSSRIFRIIITGTFSATVRLQRSVSEVGSWVDVNYWTGTKDGDYDDGLDNTVAYYRLGIKSGEYTSGTASASLSYSNGSLDGIVKITGFTSETSVSAQVLKYLGGTAASRTWEEGQWSDYRGWPSSGLIGDGRFWSAGNDKYVGSVSGTYESYDDTIEGDSAVINKSIGQGPVASINWMLMLKRLALGGDMSEYFVVSSSLDEPLTVTASSLKTTSTQGSSPIAAVKVDNSGVFVHRSGNRLFSLTFDGNINNYVSEDLSKIASELFEAGIVKLVVQRQPDTRVHILLADGSAVIMVYDPLEEVRCFISYACAGFIEDMLVLPQSGEDFVRYTVKYTINESEVRYYEKWALETECLGGTLNKQADSFLVYEGAATNTLSAPHLVGEDVIVWADGKDLSPDDEIGVQKTYTVGAGGTITLDEGVTVESAVYGLPYKARFKSSKLAEIFSDGTTLGKNKKIDQLSLCFWKTHARGVIFGRDFDHLDNLPRVINGVEVGADDILEALDNEPVAFEGTWDIDARLCLEAKAPRPCTITAAIVKVTTNA